MTRFRSRRLGALVLILALTGCAGRSGVPVEGPLGQDVSYGFIPLSRSVFFFGQWDAGAVALGGGVAVTAAHAAHMLDPASVIGTSADYDLAFFRTDHTNGVFTTDVPKPGERVVSYARYEGTPYRADGVVTIIDTPVEARCASCAVQYAFAFQGNAGPGYSGGPVLDAQSGKLIGIVFGYVDNPDDSRTIYAYPMQRVWQELKAVQARKS